MSGSNSIRHDQTREEFAAEVARQLENDVAWCESQAKKIGAEQVLRVAVSVDNYGRDLNQALGIAIATLLQNDERGFCESVGQRDAGFPTLVVNDRVYAYEDLTTEQRKRISVAVESCRTRLGLGASGVVL